MHIVGACTNVSAICRVMRMQIHKLGRFGSKVKLCVDYMGSC